MTSLDGRSQTLPGLYALPARDFADVTAGGNGHQSAGRGYAVDAILQREAAWQDQQSRNGRVNIYIGELGPGISDDRRSQYDAAGLTGPRQFLKQVLNTARARGWDWAYFEFKSDVVFQTASELAFLRDAYRGNAIR